MDNNNSDQDSPIKASRADVLLLDYLDQMFSSPSGPSKSQAHDNTPNPTVNTKRKVVGGVASHGSGTSASESDMLSGDEGSSDAKLISNSYFGHPNLKPASAVLARKKSIPFKESEDSSGVVVPGLMPRLKPAAKQQEIKPEIEQPVKQKEDVPVAAVYDERTLASETKIEVTAAPMAMPAPEKPKTVETLAIEEPQNQKEEQQVLEADLVPAEVEPESKELEPVDVSVAIDEEPPAVIPPNKVAPFRELAEFEMLLFEVRGLQLAVPLISLGSIHRLETDFTPIVGRADWYLGMYRIGDRNLQVVDTARWVMPSRMQVDSDQPYEFLIRLADTDWALACSGVQQAIRIQRDEIRWRTQQGKRPWLAGTVISKMCALLDVESMGRLLDDNKLQDTPQRN